EQEAGRKQVTRSGRVDDFAHRLGRDVYSLAAAGGERAMLAAGDHQNLDLALVGKQYVDPAAVDQLVEAIAVALDAEDVGQAEGDLASGAAGDLDRPDHRVARGLGVPQIAFKIDRRRSADLLLVERARRQVLCRAEEGVHGPVAVGRDQNHRARGRHADVERRRGEFDAGRGQVVAVE